MAFLARPRRWFEWAPWRHWRVTALVGSADEVPETLVGKEAILVGSLSSPKWLAFDCPCRSGHRILLNLDQSRYPFWTLVELSKMTVRPSIDFRDNRRRCHYIVAHGRIHWAKDEGDHRG